MPPSTDLLAFVAAALVLLLSPGPAVLFLVTRSLHGGRRAGYAAVFGLFAGGLVHAAAAVLGLSAIVASSAELFTALQLAGAAYLVWLGIQALRRPEGLQIEAQSAVGDASQAFRDAFVVEVFNPKPALFFLAFLPQFVHSGGASPARQIAQLGLLFLVLALATNSLYVTSASSLRHFLSKRPAWVRRQRYLVGATYLGLGFATAISGRKPS